MPALLSFKSLKLFSRITVPKCMRMFKLIIVVLLTGTIASCSLIKTIYNNAPEAVHWWLDDYFNFTQAQTAILNPALHKLHDWHRQSQLPIYISLMQQMQNDLSQEKLTADTVCATIGAIQDNLQAIQLEASPIILEMAPTITDKQLAYFEEKLQKRADKWQSEWLQETRKEQLEARLEKTIDYAERIYGDLHQSQKAMLKQKLLAANFKPEISYQEILRRNDDALKIMSTLATVRLTQAQQQQLLKQAFQRLRISPNHEYQRYADQAKQRSCEMIADLHTTTDTKQKQHAIAWLENFITQFKTLSYSTINMRS